METLYRLIEVFEVSVKKNGADKPLTLGHMLSILKLIQTQEEIKKQKWMEAENDFWNDPNNH